MRFAAHTTQGNLSKWQESWAKTMASGKLELAGLGLSASPGQGLPWSKNSVKIVNC